MTKRKNPMMKLTRCAWMLIALLALMPLATLAQDAVRDTARAANEPPAAAIGPAADATDGTPEPTTDATPDATTDSPPAEKTKPGTLRFHLMDGSIITGRLENDTLPIKTEFGDLVVPITKIENFAPGLAAHPDLDQKIQKLIEQLGSPNSPERDKAQAELIAFGPGLIPELQNHTEDPDAERKVRINTIIEELYGKEDEFSLDTGPTISLVRLDAIVTADFTLAGGIQQQTFNIESKYGKLVVQLADIKLAERISSEAPEVRRVISVAGSDMAGMNYKNTGIRINRGDRVIINADGRITLTPWGNGVTSGPDGVPQNGMYNGNIPIGGLAGRIGDRGEEFMVGSKNSFVADRSGVLYLGFAMRQDWANYQFPGEYEARVRVVPAE